MIGGTALAIGTAPVIIVGGTVITGTTIASVAGIGALITGTIGMASGLTEVRTGMEGYSLTGEKLDSNERTSRVASGIVDVVSNVLIVDSAQQINQTVLNSSVENII